MSTELTSGEIIARLHRGMDAATALPADDVDNVQSLIDVGEWLVAFETLCTQVYEWGISLPPRVIGDLERLGHALGAPGKYAERLWQDATDS
jgi:hypothetical protein